MLAVLIEIEAFDRDAGQRVTIRASSVDDDRVCHLGGDVWWPALLQLPALRYDLFDGAFGARIVSPQSSLTMAVEAWPELARWMFADASIRIWTGTVGARWDDYLLRFDGRVSAQPSIAAGVATIGFAVDDRWLDQPLLATYAGTTGIEGPLALKGQPKPLALGAPRYVPGQMVDAVNSVLQLSAYGAIEAVDAALERLARFGPSSGDFGSYAALVAAVVPPGGWATCLAQGLVRHGAPPAGRLSYLMRGDKAGPDAWARLPGAVIKRIALLSGGQGKISVGSLEALDSARPWPISLYINEQTTARELIQRVATSVHAVAGVSWLGKLFVVPLGIQDPALTLDATGEALPPVRTVEQVEVATPFWKLAIGAERTWNVHPLSDVAFTAVIVPRGLYVASESYREGHQVDLADGSGWLYVNPAASTGNAPPATGTVNAWWQQITPPTELGALAGEVDYGTQVGGAARPEDSAEVNGWIVGTNEMLVPANYLGTVPAAQLPKLTTFRLFRGGAEVTDGVAWSQSILSGILMSSISGTGAGVFEVASLSTDARVKLTATFNGKVYPFEFKVSKDRANTPVGSTSGGGNPGTISSTSSIGGTASTAYASANAGPIVCKAGTAGKVTTTFSALFDRPAVGSSGCLGKVQWRAVGGVFADVAAESASFFNATGGAAPEQGEISFSVDKTELTVGTDYEFQLLLRGTTSTPLVFSGEFFATGT